EPLRNAYLDGIGVDAAFAGNEDLDRPVAAVKPHAALDSVTRLIPSILAAVDAKVANVRGRQQTDARMDLHVAAHGRIELPRVVDRRLHEDAPHIGPAIKRGVLVLERLANAPAQRVPVDRFLLRPIRQMPRLVIELPSDLESPRRAR